MHALITAHSRREWEDIITYKWKTTSPRNFEVEGFSCWGIDAIVRDVYQAMSVSPFAYSIALRISSDDGAFFICIASLKRQPSGSKVGADALSIVILKMCIVGWIEIAKKGKPIEGMRCGASAEVGCRV